MTSESTAEGRSMKTIDQRLIELCEAAEDQACIFRDMLENEGAFRGIKTRGWGDKWAVFDDDECRVQAIFDLAGMLAREPEIRALTGEAKP